VRVTKHFKLGVSSSSVSFLNVNVFKDNRLFIDPAVIRMEASGNKWAAMADKELVDFFDYVLLCLRTPTMYAAGKNALSQFHEPRETRLGMAATGFDGAGASERIGGDIWSALLGNPLCQVGVALLKRVEDIALFVGDVANDRISDLTSRIIIRTLVDYTQVQMRKHPKLKRNSIMHRLQVWDAASRSWETEEFELPRVTKVGAPDSALILVPKRFVHIGLRMTRGGFWSHGPIAAVQRDETKSVGVVKGIERFQRPDKKELKQRPELEDILPTNIDQTLRIWERDKDSLIEAYRQFVESKYEPLTMTQMASRIPKR
jgi:hypothetical protein